MKRTLTAIITIVLVSLICVSFSSCGEKNQINTHSNNPDNVVVTNEVYVYMM